MRSKLNMVTKIDFIVAVNAALETGLKEAKDLVVAWHEKNPDLPRHLVVTSNPVARTAELFASAGELGRFIRDLVHCDEHGWQLPCGDVENGRCPKCSDEFHSELLEQTIRAAFHPCGSPIGEPHENCWFCPNSDK